MDEPGHEDSVRRAPKSPLAREIGRLVRSHRVSRGLTVRDVADAALCTEHEIRRVELGYHEPTIRTVRKLAAALGADVSALIPGG